jgi:hypothetical protein
MKITRLQQVADYAFIKIFSLCLISKEVPLCHSWLRVSGGWSELVWKEDVQQVVQVEDGGLQAASSSSSCYDCPTHAGGQPTDLGGKFGRKDNYLLEITKCVQQKPHFERPGVTILCHWPWVRLPPRTCFRSQSLTAKEILPFLRR